MQTGVITPDNLSQVLRQLSQKRKQGILEISCGETHQQIYFVQGRIVEATTVGISLMEELLRTLQLGGYLESSDELPLEWVEAEEYRDLFLMLNEGVGVVGVIDEELFKRVVHHRVLEKLYSLDLSSGAYYTFKVQMIEYDRDFSPSLSVGQLLLDLVALETDQANFNEIFQDESVIGVPPGKNPALNEEEQVVFDLIGDGCTVANLRERSMLSRYHFQDALMTLQSKGDITFLAELPSSGQAPMSGDNGMSAGETDAPDLSMVDDIVAALEDSIDSDFAIAADELGDMESAFADISETNFEDLPPDEVDEFVDEEEDDDDEYEDDDEYVGYASTRARMNILNMKLLHASWVPQTLVWIFIAVAALTPWFMWGDVVRKFGQF